MKVTGDGTPFPFVLSPSDSSSQHGTHHKLKPQQELASYPEARNISPEARAFCQIISDTSHPDIERALSIASVRTPPSDIVEEVLKLSYNSPSNAVKFFRWAGRNQKLSSYAWNLMVDLLGKNTHFEPMWDAIRSMRQDGLLSMATFVSAFGNYCIAGRFNEAIMTFDIMNKYGVEPDIVAVNSLLSAICREENQTIRARAFFDRIKGNIVPDMDTYAILLEGWEKEGNVAEAKHVFGEMVIRIGWNPQNMSAYDAFLTTLVRGSNADEAIRFLKVMKKNNCLPGLKFFSNALDILVEQGDASDAVSLWDIMVGSGLIPNLIMYNAIIGLVTNHSNIDSAFRFLDEMVIYGAFPNSSTYNMIFLCLIKNKKVRDAAKFFHEMVKNECPPTHMNCAAAIAMLLDGDDPETAIEIWDYMIDNHVVPLDESGNVLLIGLCKMGRCSEVRKFAEDMLDRRISIYESTMEEMKRAFSKEGKRSQDLYDGLLRRWKAS